MSLVFVDNFKSDAFTIFKPGRWSLKMSRISQAISANRSKIRKLKMSAEDLEDITTTWLTNIHAESNSLWDNAYFERRNFQQAELRRYMQDAGLWH